MTANSSLLITDTLDVFRNSSKHGYTISFHNIQKALTSNCIIHKVSIHGWSMDGPWMDTVTVTSTNT